MTILALLLIIGLSTAIFGIFAYIAKKKGINPIPITVLTAICVLILIYVLILIMVSSSHGLKSLAESKGETIWDMPVAALSFHGFAEDRLPEDTKGVIIIFVKYGCPDCLDIESTIRDFASHDNVYIIHSTSAVGQELIARYNITDVPSAVYIRINDYNGGLEYTQKSLYMTDELGNITPNLENIQRLLELQSQQR